MLPLVTGTRRLAGALVLLLCTSAAQAHEFWLVPHDAVTERDRQVVFELRIGPTWPGVQSPRLKNLVDWFKARDAQGVREVAGRDGSLAVGHLTARETGATVVAMRTNRAHLELSADEFNQYLKEEGLTDVLQMRRKFGLDSAPGREYFSRCAKSIVLVGGESHGYDQLMQLPLELVPQSDPMELHGDGEFALQLLLAGKPLEGALVKAQLQVDPPLELSAVTDVDGRVRLPLPRPGLWLFNAVHMAPSAEDDADWESLWASLTLQLSNSKKAHP